MNIITDNLIGIIISTIIALVIVYKAKKSDFEKSFYKLSKRKSFVDNPCETVGDYFEQDVAYTLEMNNDVYRVYNNLYFRTPDLRIEHGEVARGTIVQQDILAITKYGILAIECKCYDGVVTMSTGPKWYRNGEPFQNPVNQNQNHINVLKRITNQPDMPIFNAVVFDSSVTNLMAIPGEEDAVLEKYPYIARYNNLNRLVDNLKRTSNVKITKKEANKYHKMFIDYMYPSEVVKQAQLLYAMKQEAINH